MIEESGRHLWVGPGDLPELQLIFRLQRSISLETMTAGGGGVDVAEILP